MPCWRTICDTEHRPDGHDANDTTGDGTLAASPRSFCFGRKQPFQSRYVQNKDTYIYTWYLIHQSKLGCAVIKKNTNYNTPGVAIYIIVPVVALHTGPYVCREVCGSEDHCSRVFDTWLQLQKELPHLKMLFCFK